METSPGSDGPVKATKNRLKSCEDQTRLIVNLSSITRQTHHGVELRVVSVHNAQDVSGVHDLHRETGQPAGNAGP